MADAEIVGIFLEEAADIVSTWEKECLVLEKNMDNPNYDGLFRCAHNIKGAAKSVGLDAFGEFVHQVEDVINLLKSGQIKLIEEFLEFLLKAQSVLALWVEELQNNPDFVADTKDIIAKVEEIKKFADIMSDLDGDVQDFGTIAINSGIATAEQVTQAVNIQNRKIGEIMVDEGMIKKGSIEEILGDQDTQQKTQGVKRGGTESIRISAQKIDKLIQLVGELSIHQSIISHAKKTESLDSYICGNAINLAAKINSEIQSQALSLRMLPLEGLFQRVERIIRDIARSLGKKVNVKVKGSDVELDKMILEKITDPLIHIVRNAIDHGVESPEERVKDGKPEEATVTISGVQDATGISIIVSDDGRGLNVKKILQKARDMGIVEEDEELTESEIHHLIFSPSFSTADKVTDISGRGVGMDVVKQAVLGVGGVLGIDSDEGKGSSFTISLPTTLSIIDGLIVEVNQNRYIVPLMDLAEIIDLDSFTIEETGAGEKRLNLRGKIVPVETLEDYFPKSNKVKLERSEEQIGFPALILEIDGDKVAFSIDEIVSQQQIVVRPLNEHLGTIHGYSGGTIMADGEAGMIIGLQSIARRYFDSVSRF